MLHSKDDIISGLADAIQKMMDAEGEHEFDRGVRRGMNGLRQELSSQIAVLETELADSRALNVRLGGPIDDAESGSQELLESRDELRQKYDALVSAARTFRNNTCGAIEAADAHLMVEAIGVTNLLCIARAAKTLDELLEAK